MSCWGTGELPGEFGPNGCPDCGGSGILPSRAVLVDWRARDIERAYAADESAVGASLRWLIAELRTARDALSEVAALAHDIDDESGIARHIRLAASRALGIYDALPAPEDEKAR